MGVLHFIFFVYVLLLIVSPSNKSLVSSIFFLSKANESTLIGLVVVSLVGCLAISLFFLGDDIFKLYVSDCRFNVK